jgi:hypothetical protein
MNLTSRASVPNRFMWFILKDCNVRESIYGWSCLYLFNGPSKLDSGRYRKFEDMCFVFQNWTLQGGCIMR